MAQYRKTALVEAEQFIPGEGKIPAGVISDGNGDPRKDTRFSWIVASLEGNHYAKSGDYILTGIKGEKWVVDKEIFEATYEEQYKRCVDALAKGANGCLSPWWDRVEPTPFIVGGYEFGVRSDGTVVARRVK